MRLGIVTDSTCDLPADLAERFEISVVPSLLVVDGTEYPDGEGMSREEFYQLLAARQHMVSTAAPSTGEFATRYEALLAGGCDQILSIHAAASLTGILSAAEQASTQFNGRISVLDSTSLSLGLGFQVLAAAEAGADGLMVAAAAAKAARRRTRLLAALGTMEYVRRSGRVRGAMAAFGGLLSIKPIVELRDGDVKRFAAPRTTAQADERMLKAAAESGALERLAILHTSAEARARAFLDQLMHGWRQYLPREILIVNVTPVVGAHVGPGGLGFVSVTAAG